MPPPLMIRGWAGLEPCEHHPCSGPCVHALPWVNLQTWKQWNLTNVPAVVAAKPPPQWRRAVPAGTTGASSCAVTLGGHALRRPGGNQCEYRGAGEPVLRAPARGRRAAVALRGPIPS